VSGTRPLTVDYSVEVLGACGVGRFHVARHYRHTVPPTTGCRMNIYAAIRD
jgi:hypothetical protein